MSLNPLPLEDENAGLFGNHFGLLGRGKIGCCCAAG